MCKLQDRYGPIIINFLFFDCCKQDRYAHFFHCCKHSLFILNSLKIFDSKFSTRIIQGSILGPILYAIYVAPLFDLAYLSNFADDNFILTFNKLKQIAITLMENKLKVITKWLKDSCLKVNKEITELIHFYRKDTPPCNDQCQQHPYHIKG